jgi:hypothetical protein
MSIVHFFLFCIFFLIIGVLGVLLGRYINSNKVKSEGSSSFLVGIIIFLGGIFLIDVIRKAILVGKEKDGNWHWAVDIKEGSIPEYLAFFIAGISAVYLYKALTEQRKANQIAQFEARFFKFIDYHRENVSTMKYRNPKVDTEQTWEGIQVFTIIYKDIEDLLKEYLHNKFIKNGLKPTLPDKVAAINFIYQCVFYGFVERTREDLEKKFKAELIFLPSIKKNAKYKSGGKTVKFYSGNVRRLGHYFRNIYQAIQFVEQQDFLTYNQKYEYVAALRAQLSVFEQAIFFFNSISSLGNSWEYKKYSQYKLKGNESSVFNRLWITKYDLIRNTLNFDGVITKNININEFYPLLNLEREEELCKYGVLEFKDDKKEICRTCYNVTYLKFELDETKVVNELDISASNFTTSDKIVCSEGNNCLSKRILKTYESKNLLS